MPTIPKIPKFPKFKWPKKGAPQPLPPQPVPNPNPIPQPMPQPNPLPAPKPAPIASPPTTNVRACPVAGVIEKKGKGNRERGGNSSRTERCPNGGKPKRIKMGSKWVYKFSDWTYATPEEHVPTHEGHGSQFWMWRGGRPSNLTPEKRTSYNIAKAAAIVAGGPSPCIYKYYRRRVKYVCRCPDGSKCK